MKQYNRIMLGRAGKFAKQCREEGFIGADFGINQDLTKDLTDNLHKFNEKFVPIYMKIVKTKSKTTAGLSCGFLWTVAKGLKIGDVVLCPTGDGSYYVGTIESDYFYVPSADLPHRRKVKWMEKVILRKSMSQKLRNSTGSIGTCCNITKYAEELEALIAGKSLPLTVVQQTVEPPKAHFEERSLHKLFCTYLRTRNIYAKTIFHEKSSSKSDQAQKWVHPDIIGVEFEDFRSDSTLELLKATEPKESIHIYSYELKRKIDSDYQLKQCFFQALSNSSWANYGYLVAFDIEQDLMEEMERLNNAFGIGIIQMDASESRVLFPAREHRLDYNTIEKLNLINPNFREFIGKLSKVVMASKDYAMDARQSFVKICDTILNNDEEIEKYCREHGIPF